MRVMSFVVSEMDRFGTSVPKAAAGASQANRVSHVAVLTRLERRPYSPCHCLRKEVRRCSTLLSNTLAAERLRGSSRAGQV